MHVARNIVSNEHPAAEDSPGSDGARELTPGQSEETREDSPSSSTSSQDHQEPGAMVRLLQPSSLPKVLGLLVGTNARHCTSSLSGIEVKQQWA